jgi:hypothetical protein
LNRDVRLLENGHRLLRYDRPLRNARILRNVRPRNGWVLRNVC